MRSMGGVERSETVLEQHPERTSKQKIMVNFFRSTSQTS